MEYNWHDAVVLMPATILPHAYPAGKDGSVVEAVPCTHITAFGVCAKATRHVTGAGTGVAKQGEFASMPLGAHRWPLYTAPFVKHTWLETVARVHVFAMSPHHPQYVGG